MKLSDLDLLVNIDDTVYKLEEIKNELLLSQPEEREPYTTTIPFKLRGFIQKASDTERIIAGYASVIEVDKEEQLIPKETLQEGIETLIKNGDYANLMLVHQNIQLGKILDGYGDLTTHVDDKGLFIVCSIRDDLETANEIWEQILDGKLNGFSIAAEVLMEHEECDSEKCVLVIDKMNIFEISLCTHPVNAKSGFVVVSKSDLKDLECNVCNHLIIKDNVNMARKKKQEKVIEKAPEEDPEDESPCSCEEKSEEVVEEPVEVEEKAPEEPVEDIETETMQNTIEGLQREIEALKGIIAEMKAMPDEEEEEEEEEEMEKSEPEPKVTTEEVVEEKAEEPVVAEVVEETPTEEKSEPEPVQVDFITRDDLLDIQKAIDELTEKFSKFDEIEDLKVASKAKDDQISALTKRLEIVEQTEEKPKIKTDNKKHKKADIGFVKDPLRPGTYYRDLS